MKKGGFIHTLLNVLWCVFVGFWTGLIYLVLGLLWCITIIGIPFGKQLIKLGGLMWFPFGKKVSTNFFAYPILNIIWAVLGGFTVGIGFFVVGLILCITIIGIPAGKQCLKLAKLSFMPFGAKVK